MAYISQWRINQNRFRAIMVRTKLQGGVGESWSEELELESGVGEWSGYSRVENAEPRQVCRAGNYSGASLLSRSAKAFSMLSTWYSSYMPMA